LEHKVEQLVLLVKKRKHKAIEELMDLYIKSVYNVAKNILTNVGSEEDIEECVQDVFLDAWNNIENYDSGRGTFKTWLLIICKYKALNMRKSLANKGKIVELKEKIISLKETPEESFLSNEKVSEVIAAIKSFNNIDREVFLRRYILEQSVNDIIATMNLSRHAVDNRLWRGRKKLKKIIDINEKGRNIIE
jgi:RNA polymerase sigma-70 factor, ECF subfamily